MEAALTTALTDRPYDPLACVPGAQLGARPGRTSVTYASAGGGSPCGGSKPHRPGRHSHSSSGRRRSLGEDAGEGYQYGQQEGDEDGLAEVDFRQQYDDFA